VYVYERGKEERMKAERKWKKQKNTKKMKEKERGV
jgi:hypothetical protein